MFPPHFHFVGRFLEEYASCPGAVAALSVFLVFSFEEDASLFRESMGCLHPTVPADAWTALVPIAPVVDWQKKDKQFITAFKKFYGIAHMMDMGEAAPAYGLMLDSEIALYAGHGEAHPEACGSGGSWSRLFERIRAQEVSRVVPAARVSATAKFLYLPSGKKSNTSGKVYNRINIKYNAALVTKKRIDKCKTGPCKEVHRAIKDCLFSWWTDLPWQNLSVTGAMLTDLAGCGPSMGWRNLSTLIAWRPFEQIAYHLWSVLHEGFTFDDVTEITGEAKWGSYLEDPPDGSRLGELRPMWASSFAVQRAANGIIHNLSRDAPPLLIFHVDKWDKKGGDIPGLEGDRIRQLRRTWAEVALQGLLRTNRTDSYMYANMWPTLDPPRPGRRG